MTYISFCSGIEAASQAWEQLGWEAKAFCEIDKFPSRVLAHHSPGVPNLGDFTAVDWSQWSADICVGGTPCQAFSVAGLRQSLDDHRGNLSLEFIRAVNTIRPRLVVWENVPGVLSTNDNAFGCFLGALVGCDEAVLPEHDTPNSKYWRSVKRWAHRRRVNGEWKILRWWKPKRTPRWPNAGVVNGPERRAAWRVLDAQYFGLAQRRKRVFVIASSGDGPHPAEILFEWESLRRDTPPSREAGEGPAGTIAARTRGGGGLGTDFDCDGGVIGLELGNQGSGGNVGWHSSNKPFRTLDRGGAPGVAIAGTLKSSSGGGGFGSDPSETFVVEQNTQASTPELPSLRAHSTPNYGITHSLRGDGFDASEDGTGRVTPLVAVAIQAGALRENPDSGPDGVGVQEGLAYTLEARAEVQATQSGMAVRRLTPRECERLQGFPDDYTAIPGAADGPRYKALGNSMAVPVMRWIGERIIACGSKLREGDKDYER